MNELHFSTLLLWIWLIRDEDPNTIPANITMAIPTVLWSGNGFHVYQPVDAPILEYDGFDMFDHPFFYIPNLFILNIHRAAFTFFSRREEPPVEITFVESKGNVLLK